MTIKSDLQRIALFYRQDGDIDRAVKEYKQDVALPTNETPKTKKAYLKKQILHPPLSKKALTLHQFFYNLYHEEFKIL